MYMVLEVGAGFAIFLVQLKANAHNHVQLKIFCWFMILLHAFLLMTVSVLVARLYKTDNS